MSGKWFRGMFKKNSREQATSEGDSLSAPSSEIITVPEPVPGVPIAKAVAVPPTGSSSSAPPPTSSSQSAPPPPTSSSPTADPADLDPLSLLMDAPAPTAADVKASKQAEGTQVVTPPVTTWDHVEHPVDQDYAPVHGTTVMVKNLPNDYSREDLLEMLDSKGLKCHYDFVYLPRDVNRKAGKGYAFVNFDSHDAAVKCINELTGFRDWTKKGSGKVCQVVWGREQGKVWAVEKYRNHWTNNSAVEDSHKPALFDNGVRIEFPNPTKRLRPPPGSSKQEDQGAGGDTVKSGQASSRFDPNDASSYLADDGFLEPQVLAVETLGSFGKQMQSFGGPDGWFEHRDEEQHRAATYLGGGDMAPVGAFGPPGMGMMPPMGVGPMGYAMPFGGWAPPPMVPFPGGPPPATSAEDYERLAKHYQEMAELKRRSEGQSAGQRGRADVPGSLPIGHPVEPAASSAFRPADDGSDGESGCENGASTLEESQYTTVMFKNLPNDYTRDDFLDLMNANGFAGLYDFVYLPMDFSRNAGKGYAFVNLIDHKEAERFQHHFQGWRTWKNASQKVAELQWGAGPQQGIAANKRQYRDSPLMHPDVPDQYKPLLFEMGVRVAFPKPTKALKRPRHFQASGSRQ